MSEHRSLWQHKNNGEICVRRTNSSRYVIGGFDAHGVFERHATDDELPEGFVPLVPQTEVDAVKAELILDHRREVAHALGWSTDHAVLESWAGLLHMVATKAARAAKDAPSLPAVDSPEGLHYVAAAVNAWVANHNGPEGWNVLALPMAQGMRREADRLEREQAEKAKRDKMIEDVARISIGYTPEVWDAMHPEDRDAARDRIRAILARFDITPKAVES